MKSVLTRISRYDAPMPGLTIMVQTTTVAMLMRRESGVSTCKLSVTNSKNLLVALLKNYGGLTGRETSTLSQLGDSHQVGGCPWLRLTSDYLVVVKQDICKQDEQCHGPSHITLQQVLLIMSPCPLLSVKYIMFKIVSPCLCLKLDVAKIPWRKVYALMGA